MNFTPPPITQGPWLIKEDSHRMDSTRFEVFSETPSRNMQEWRKEHPDLPPSGFENSTRICSTHVSLNGSGEQSGPRAIIGAEEVQANTKAISALPAVLSALEFLLGHCDPNDKRHLVPDEVRTAAKTALELAGYQFN